VLISLQNENEDENENDHESENESESENQLLLLSKEKFSYLQLKKRESKTEEKNDHENEDDEIEIKNKQCRKRLSRYTKTDDAKCENVVNRLRFIKLKKLKKLKKKLFFRKEKFFSRCEIAKTSLLVSIEISDCMIEVSELAYLFILKFFGGGCRRIR
jgi:exonuclease VII large subunit